MIPNNEEVFGPSIDDFRGDFVTYQPLTLIKNIGYVNVNSMLLISGNKSRVSTGAWLKSVCVEKLISGLCSRTGKEYDFFVKKSISGRYLFRFEVAIYFSYFLGDEFAIRFVHDAMSKYVFDDLVQNYFKKLFLKIEGKNCLSFPYINDKPIDIIQLIKEFTTSDNINNKYILKWVEQEKVKKFKKVLDNIDGGRYIVSSHEDKVSWHLALRYAYMHDADMVLCLLGMFLKFGKNY